MNQEEETQNPSEEENVPSEAAAEANADATEATGADEESDPILDFLEPEEESEEPSADAEINKWKDLAARSQADLDNFRKRMAREKSEAIQYANRSLLEQLLPIIDNFEMGLKAASDAEGESSMILQGMSMVHKQFADFLTDQGVSVIDPVGEVFDPNLHEALKQEASEEVPEGHVIYTMRRGYQLKDRILRAANVVVSSGAGE